MVAQERSFTRAADRMGRRPAGRLTASVSLALMAALVVALTFGAALIGPFAITPAQVVEAVVRKLSGGVEPAAAQIDTVLFAVRLPRIGAVTAEHIIAARPFNAVEDLRGVQGITNAIFSAVKDKVSV